MRQLVLVAFALSLLTPSSSVAGARCGDDPGDAAAVAAAEAAIAAQCSCCGPQPFTACVASVVKTLVRGTQLRRPCVAKLRRDVGRGCPLAATAPCKLCSADADCGSGEFCECRRGSSCSKTGGVCNGRPQVCPDAGMPVCGCNGTTYGNDCLRKQAGTCKLHDGPCVAIGGCFDTIAGSCTGEACSPAIRCPLANTFCSPACASPPPTGRCFDTLARRCTTETCGPDHACLPNEFCVTTCPPPPPTGKCFVTVDNQCSEQPCGPGVPCRNPNEFCDPQCGTPTCTGDGDCNDGNPCTADTCVGGTCDHACVCVGPTGAATCCPGPGTSCAQPCGDTFPTCDGSCPVGSACASLSGAPACQCVQNPCAPCTSCGDGSFFLTCGDPVCGGHRPHDGIPPCTTEHQGDPCSCPGQACDPGDDCNRLLQCATSDPTHGGICPISRRAFKTNIHYLNEEEITRLRDDLLRFRLASYQYSLPNASAATHLGFIIDDVEPSPSVAPNGDTVDVYGYASMAVAAVQTQARAIDALQREVAALRAELRKATHVRGDHVGRRE